MNPSDAAIDRLYQDTLADTPSARVRERQPKPKQEHHNMRRFGEGESRYVKGSDLQNAAGGYDPVLCVIDHVAVETIMDDEPEKYILYFKGKKKGMVLNRTNEEILIGAYGMPQTPNDPAGLTAHFGGKPVEIYFDPSIMFGAKRVGGLRLRPVSAAMSQQMQPPPAAEEPPHPADAADDQPF